MSRPSRFLGSEYAQRLFPQESQERHFLEDKIRKAMQSPLGPESEGALSDREFYRGLLSLYGKRFLPKCYRWATDPIVVSMKIRFIDSLNAANGYPQLDDCPGHERRSYMKMADSDLLSYVTALCRKLVNLGHHCGLLKNGALGPEIHMVDKGERIVVQMFFFCEHKSLLLDWETFDDRADPLYSYHISSPYEDCRGLIDMASHDHILSILERILTAAAKKRYLLGKGG